MKLTMRATAFGKKVTLFSTAFILAVSSLTAVVPFVLSQQASALSMSVTESTPQGWAAEDGHPVFVAGPTGTTGNGSLKLTTDSEPKQNFYHAANNVALKDVTGLGYKLNVTAGVPASYQLQVIGVTGAKGWTTLVWEQVYNGGVNGPTAGFVTHSNLENGTWWSSNAIDGAPNRDTFVPLSTIIAANPNAQVKGYGVNLGSGTPNATSYVDNITFMGDVSNFEATPPAAPGNLTISHNGTNVKSGTTVAPSFLSGNTVLNFDAVQGSVKYITEVTYPGGVKNVSNSYHNTWLVKNGVPAQGEFSTHGDGTYSYRVKARDTTTGLESSWSAPVSLTYDSTAPTITSITANGSPIAMDGSTKVSAKNGITFKVVASDPAGFGYTYVEMNKNLVWKAAATGAASTTLTTAADKYVDGSVYGLKICSYDKVSNGACSQVYFTIDNTAPVATIIAPSDGATVRGVVNLQGVVTDANPMNSYFKITGPNGYVKDSLYRDGRLEHDYSWNTTALENGVYTIQFETRDAASNKDAGSVAYITVTVDNAIAATIDTIATNTTNPVISGVITYHADSAPVANANVVVTVGGTNYDTQTDGNGAWAVPVTVTSGQHVVAVALKGAGTTTPLASTLFTTVLGQSSSTAGGNDAANAGGTQVTAPQAFVAPAAINPGAIASVLGDSTNTPSATQSNDPEGSSDVKGTSTAKTLAAAVNNTDGKALGLAWYWWLLIVAALAAFVWWIVAGIRNRQAEN